MTGGYLQGYRWYGDFFEQTPRPEMRVRHHVGDAVDGAAGNRRALEHVPHFAGRECRGPFGNGAVELFLMLDPPGVV